MLEMVKKLLTNGAAPRMSWEIDDVLSKLTLEEKISLLSGSFRPILVSSMACSLADENHIQVSTSGTLHQCTGWVSLRYVYQMVPMAFEAQSSLMAFPQLACPVVGPHSAQENARALMKQYVADIFV
jgi:hypothetical protein